MFLDSCITKLQGRAAREEATVPPLGIMPCYVGTGNTVMSVDASGLQGLNNRQQYAYTLDQSNSTSGDMYVLSNGRISDHISEQNILPYGYFDWEMDLEGRETVTSENFCQTCALWERELRTDSGTVSTRFVVCSDVRTEIALTAPKGTDCIVMRVRTAAHYVIPNGAPEEEGARGKLRHARLTVRLNMKTRQGKKLFDAAVLDGNTLNVAVKGHENYRYAIRATVKRMSESADCAENGTADGALSFLNGVLSLSADVSCNAVSETKTVFVFDFGGAHEAIEADLLERENFEARSAYFDRIARISGLDERESFLYYNTHNLLLSGFDYAKGLPIGAPFFFPNCWRASTFWDSHFVMDGLMRCGAKEEAKTFLRFLKKCLKNEGNPYSWMFLYDGTSTIADERDIAPLVIAAHAHTALNFEEYFGDKDVREECVFPIASRCCRFASEKMFARDADGRYILSMAVSNDVVDEVPDELNQTFTIVWFLSIFQKYQRLRETMGLAPDERIAEILANHRIENDGNEYFHSKGYSAADYRWGSWIPYLCYPTEAMPLLDMEMVNRTSETYSFRNLYMDKQSCFQPWTEMIEANSDFRRGDVEKGYRFRRIGMSHAYGMGYFCEVGAKQWCVTVPPYVSAHGSYLTSLLFQFVATDSLTDRIGLFTCAHSDYDARTISVSGVVCCGGITVDALRSPDELRATLVSDRELNLEVDVKLPANLDPNLVRITVNGIPVEADRKIALRNTAERMIGEDTKTVSLKIRGTKRAEIFVY